MQPEKWEQTKGHILDSFSDVSIDQRELDYPEMGKKETVLFTGPLGQMKLEYYTKPVVLDKKSHGSRRIGSQIGVEYVYSRDESVNFLKAYRWDEGRDDWQEIEIAKGSFSL